MTTYHFHAITRETLTSPIDSLCDVPDTATGEHFYPQSGWLCAGEMPRYALIRDGNVTGTTNLYKFI
ncbi:hypothetical protein [Kosakonia oryzae]|uniref:Uncharacterized protein n=1 Tax=Kosakonia oryzae TaxID=497725 RepID=A0A807BEP5_9ENTR|nr:hypothetical protein AWR26_13415 [Kosakonia oryzae]